LPSDRVLVVGAGIGGLVSALELAAAGREVIVVERAEHPGGKMREVEIDGVKLDAGPTVFTMRWVFEELFERIGATLADHLVLRPLHVLARHAWSAREQLDLHADIAQSAAAIGAFAGAADARGYLEFCARARRIYRTLEQPFLRSSRPNPLSLGARVGPGGLVDLARIAPFSRLWSSLGTHFRDPRLQQLFGRYATYCGASPFLAPTTLMLVAHVEQDGVWLVDGGMHQLAATLALLARRHGAQLRYRAHVDELVVADGRVAGVRLADGEQIDADAVIFNGDAGALAAGKLGAPARSALGAVGARRRSLSALTWNVVAPTSGFALLRHNVFFSSCYAREFDDIFGHSRLPGSPTVYVCAQDRGDAHDPEPGALRDGRAERLLCLVNAPPTADLRPLSQSELASCEVQTFQRLATCGLQIQRSNLNTVRTTPADFERLFPATGGSLYGQASHGWMASFRRPGARSRLPGLYLAGGSTHPGPGVPMAALSARQAVASLLADRDSISRLHPVATRGGMSMR
jgi:1-hydroxycarotenoid 3,4-desaturase